MDSLARSTLKMDVLANTRPQDTIEESPAGIDVIPNMRHTSRTRAFFEGMGLGALRGLASGGRAGAVAGAAGGAVVGALSPAAIERAKRKEAFERQRGIVKSQVEVRGEQAKLQDLQAQTTQRLSDAAYNNARPSLDRAALQQKYDAMSAEEKRATRQGLISLMNGFPEFDPERDVQVVDAFKAVGLPVPPKKARGQESHLIHDEKSGQTYTVNIDKSTGGSTSSLVKAPGADSPLVTTSPTQVNVVEHRADRASRESEGARNRQNQRDLVGLRGDRKANRDYQEAQNLVNQFNKLTVDAARARLPRQRDTILATRDNVESNLRSRFPDIIELDDKGKPSRLKARTPASGSSGPRVVPLTAAPGQKSITDYAQKHSMTVEAARRKFEADGWTVQ
jgi:hypothetical protein